MALLATAVVHAMVLANGFREEDLMHLFSARARGFEYLVTPYGGHFIATYGILMEVLDAVFGYAPGAYFGLAYLTHLGNTALMYGVIRAYTQRRVVAALAAGLWGSAPAFQGTLQWFAAYGHMLGVSATLWCLWELARAAEARKPPPTAAFVRMNVVLLLGAATELTGTVTAAGFVIVAYLMLPPECKPLRSASRLLPASLLTVAMVVTYISGSAGMARSATFASTTEALYGMVVYGVGVVVAGPVVTLDAKSTSMGVFDGGTPGLAVGVSTLIAVPALALVVWRLVRGDRTERLLLVGLLGLAGAMYGGVAMGRSGFLAMQDRLMWLATRDRYHYDGSPGLIIAVALAMTKLRPRIPWPPPKAHAVWFACIGVGWTATNVQVARNTYLNRGYGTQSWIREYVAIGNAAIDSIVRASPRGEPVYVRNDRFRPAHMLYAFGKPQWQLPGIGAAWVLVNGTKPVDDRAVRFVEYDEKVLSDIRANLEAPDVKEMFVSPEDVEIDGGRVRTIQRDAPVPAADFLQRSIHPLFGVNDYDWVERAARSVRVDSISRFPGPETAPALPAPSTKPASPSNPPESAGEDSQPEASSAADEQRRKMAEALRKDPEKLEALKRRIQSDPELQERWRKAIQEKLAKERAQRK